MPVKKSPEKKLVKKVTVRKPTAKTEIISLSVPMFDLSGKEVGKLSLPKKLFGVKINEPLLAQALRVYLNNNTAHFAHTKTRGEVKGSTRKIRAQKGTGGARHGGVRAPIFVGGGISLGPKYRKIELELPKKMKKAALISALSTKAKDKEIIGISNLDKLTGKTKEMKVFLDKITVNNALLIIAGQNEKLQRAVNNLPLINYVLASQLGILEMIKHKSIILTKEAVSALEERILKNESGKKEKLVS